METKTDLSFFARLGMAFSCFSRILSDASFARSVATLLSPAQPKVELPPERLHASGLSVLALLQREGRLIDFLQEDMSSFPDADIGAAARVVHGGCRKVLAQCVPLEPAMKDAEGARISIPVGFDSQRIRLTGNVAGQPPFNGTLKHHGWIATAVRLPSVSESLDPRVIAPAEVEI